MLFLAVVFLAGAVFFAEAEVFAAVVLRAGAFLVALELDVVLLGEDLLALDFEVDLLGVDLLVELLVDLAGLDLVVDLLGADLLVDFEAVDFDAVVLAGLDFEVALLGVDLLVDLDAVVFEGLVFDAVDFFAAVPFWAALAVSEALGGLASFLAPDTTAFRSAPAVNFGMAVFFARTRSPVRGLRTHRASRTRFSNEPKPVIATFSPRDTSRVMTSSTESSACLACLRLPS